MGRERSLDGRRQPDLEGPAAMRTLVTSVNGWKAADALLSLNP